MDKHHLQIWDTKDAISNNKKQFDCKLFLMAYPQTNGQTKVTNRDILQGLKKQLDVAKKSWASELPNSLWAFQTTSRTPTGETPFALTYGIEAIIHVEL